MEINQDLHNYIISFDNILEEKVLDCFTKVYKTKNFKKAKIFLNGHDEKVEEDVRKTSYYPLNAMSSSLTDAHWYNYFKRIFSIFIQDYVRGNNLNVRFNKILDMQILKYVEGGHYKFHVDEGPATHRTFSCIFLINDNYEGGELVFKYPKSEKILKIEKKKNKLIIWPSNFLYPHSVLPVTKGERYSIVSWAL